MTKYVVNKSRDFTAMSNHHLRDKRLSLKAKGLLSVILMLPDDWKYSISGLATLSKDGDAAVRSAMGELRDAGYVIMRRLPPQKGRGTFEYVYDIYEIGQDNMETSDIHSPDEDPSFLHIEDLHVEDLHVENRRLLNTKEQNTKTHKKERASDASSDEPGQLTLFDEPEKKPRRKKAEPFDDVIAGFTSDPRFVNVLGEFIRMRERIKKPLTSYALKLRLKKLWSLADTDEERIAIVEQSIGASWQDFYPLGREQNGGQHERAKGYGSDAFAAYQRKIEGR